MRATSDIQVPFNDEGRLVPNDVTSDLAPTTNMNFSKIVATQNTSDD